MAVNSFRDLRVWQQGMDLVEEVYRLTLEFPKQETYGLAAQVRRAAVSVPANIAEGHSRVHTREYLHHVSIAQASLAEVQTELEIAGRLQYIFDKPLGAVMTHAVSLSKQLHALRNALLKTE